MKIASNVSLKGPIWAEMLDKLVDVVFETYWDVYALCISIGMMADEQIDSKDMVPSDYTDEPKTIPKSVLLDETRNELLEFMLQAALVTTKHLDFSEEQRLQLAFYKESDKDSEISFKPLHFLTMYANYGIVKLKEAVDDATDVDLLFSIMAFLHDTYEKDYISTDDIELDLADDID